MDSQLLGLANLDSDWSLFFATESGLPRLLPPSWLPSLLTLLLLKLSAIGEPSLSGRGDSMGEFGDRASLLWLWACGGGGGSYNGGGGEDRKACGEGEVSIAGGVIVSLDPMAELGSGNIVGPRGEGGVFEESRLFSDESLPREKIEEIRLACLLVMVKFSGPAMRR